MNLVYPAVFYPNPDSSAFAVTVPDLPGCVSGGSSLPEAIAMGEDAASGWILGELEDGNEIPAASNITDIHPDPEIGEGFVSLLSLDMDSYAAKYGSKSIRKNLTIPAWLNTFAEAEQLNVSKVLQDALTSLYEKKNTAIA
ncbi:type II toxin-antitoxin system HicB family antitoxin [uncultured Selenomonas sp.]|uniref:type II toxin-antitoxin system HicB family antitoxin n=1 Tax=uncultured Selenomonas sp. TaxID=159275 RepID=UPI0028D557CC|nr:type II toxin-antitoxin system HicB family antitoxin [uncultured Selenomonas sp.]